MDFDKLKEEMDKPKKFGTWFEKEFDCEKRNGSLVCNIDGEMMKVQNSVRNAQFREGEKENMVKAVMENHEVNKEAGITYGDTNDGKTVQGPDGH